MKSIADPASRDRTESGQRSPAGKKIAQIVECFAYGAAKSVRQLCNTLDAERITIYYGTRVGTELELPDLGTSVRWVALPGRGAFKHLSNLFFLARELEADTEIVHAHSTFAGLYAKTLHLFGRGSVVFYSPRGYSFLKQDCTRLMRFAYWMFEKATAPLCLTVACGPAEYAIARSLSQRVCQINNAESIPEDLDCTSTGSGILSVGRIGPQKGFDVFLQIAERLPDHAFTWIGDPDPSYEHLMQQIPDNVTVEPGLPHKELLNRIRTARFVLLPSRWEGLSRFLIESLCVGKAIVTSQCPSNIDCLQASTMKDGWRYENGFSCKTVDEYVTAIKRLDDDTLLISMQRAAITHAATSFSFNVVSNQWKLLYRSQPSTTAMDRLDEVALQSAETQCQAG